MKCNNCLGTGGFFDSSICRACDGTGAIADQTPFDITKHKFTDDDLTAKPDGDGLKLLIKFDADGVVYLEDCDIIAMAKARKITAEDLS